MKVLGGDFTVDKVKVNYCIKRIGSPKVYRKMVMIEIPYNYCNGFLFLFWLFVPRSQFIQNSRVHV